MYSQLPVIAVRRSEIDLTIGTTQTYAQVGYLKLNRNIDPLIEDLRDKEELRVAARLLFHRYWSIFGATVIDLTDKREANHMPDFAPAAWKESDGSVNLTVSHFQNYRMRGPDLEHLTSDPQPVFQAAPQRPRSAQAAA